MEKVRKFYNDLLSFFDEEQKKDDLYVDQISGYKSVGNFDWIKTQEYRESITNKLFSLDEKTRLIYAKAIISEFDTHLFVARDFICNKVITKEVMCVRSDESVGFRLLSIEEAEKSGLAGEQVTRQLNGQQIQSSR